MSVYRNGGIAQPEAKISLEERHEIQRCGKKNGPKETQKLKEKLDLGKGPAIDNGGYTATRVDKEKIRRDL